MKTKEVEEAHQAARAQYHQVVQVVTERKNINKIISITIRMMLIIVNKKLKINIEC